MAAQGGAAWRWASGRGRRDCRAVGTAHCVGGRQAAGSRGGAAGWGSGDGGGGGKVVVEGRAGRPGGPGGQGTSRGRVLTGETKARPLFISLHLTLLSSQYHYSCISTKLTTLFVMLLDFCTPRCIQNGQYPNDSSNNLSICVASVLVGQFAI